MTMTVEWASGESGRCSIKFDTQKKKNDAFSRRTGMGYLIGKSNAIFIKALDKSR